MNEEADAKESPEEFLSKVGERLKTRKGVDVGVAEILASHILKVAPAQNAVSLAKESIVQLAASRASCSPADGSDE